MKKKIASWIKKQVKEAGAKGCVLGLSGGVDSAVVAALCKLAFPKNVMGILMPCYSDPQDLKDAQKIARKFSISTRLVDLKRPFNQLYLQLQGKKYNTKEENLAIANMKPRLRMLTLYYYANQLNYLVVGTGNKSEAVMGYCTKYGDGGVDLLPLAELLKTQVRELARDLGIPEEIISKPPSAGLWAGQTDEAEMGISYDDLDRIIVSLKTGQTKGLDSALVKKVKEKMKASEHKRCMPPSFKL